MTGLVASQSLSTFFQLVGSPQHYGLRGVYLTAKSPLSGSLELYGTLKNPDRYSRLTVQAFQGSATRQWVQGQLLREGKALVYAFGENPNCLSAMKLAERLGEKSKTGIWALGNLPWRAQDLGTLSEKLGHFALIEGKVLSVGNRKKRLYLNFGQNWSQDFTVSLVKKGKGAFKGDVERIIGLKGKIIRVRGILEQRQGPLIRLIDEAQIEIIE